LKKPRKESVIYPLKLLITFKIKTNKINGFNLSLRYGKRVGKYVKKGVDSSTFGLPKIQSKT
jgi:hypothetical protein